MRRAAYILSWFCVSAISMPVTLRAAADTNSRSGVVMARSAADSLPQAVRNTPPRSATLSNIQNYDPHPFITEFIGPAPAPKVPPKTKSAATKPLPQAQLSPAPK
ncbi:MAG: hypothetical protein ABIP81_08530 [Terriglobales bacterium]